MLEHFNSVFIFMYAIYFIFMLCYLVVLVCVIIFTWRSKAASPFPCLQPGSSTGQDDDFLPGACSFSLSHLA